MKKRNIYSKSPITEAVIEIKVLLPESITLDNLRSVQNKISAQYPSSETILLSKGALSTEGKQLKTSVSYKELGISSTSIDKKYIFQSRFDCFCISRLAPYEKWENFRKEAVKIWKIYLDNARPLKIIKIGIRFINEIKLPVSINDFKDYLKTVPEISPEMPQGLSRYFMQLQIPYLDIKSVLTLNQGLPPVSTPNPAHIPIILDSDIACEKDLPDLNKKKDLWKFIDKMHHKSDEIFEACITDKTRRLIK